MSDKYSSELNTLFTVAKDVGRIVRGKITVSPEEYAEVQSLLRRVEKGAHPSSPSDEMEVGGKQVVTQSELAANKSIGWYANPGGVVYQVMTINPRKVRYIGRLEQVNDLAKNSPDTTTESLKSAQSPPDSSTLPSDTLDILTLTIKRMLTQPGLTVEQATAEAAQTITNLLAEAYKKGYIDGSVRVALNHTKGIEVINTAQGEKE